MSASLLDRPVTVRVLAAASAVLLVVSLIGLASLPAGASSPRGVVPDGRRVAASTSVRGVRVMVLSSSGRLNLLVAYEGEKGWHGVEVDPAPRNAVAAWAATQGAGDVPALSAVYGRAEGARVRVEWADGETAEAPAATDGTYLVARPGRVRSEHVTVLGGDGAVLTEVDGP
jgi:hypothetical protein